MKTLYNFVDKYKNEKVTSETFCEVDSLVFAALSYLDLEKFVPSTGDIGFKDVFSFANWKVLKKTTWVPGSDKKLLKLLEKSTRYDDLRLSFSSTVNITKTTTQFYAIRFSLPGDISFLVFRGTDKTFFGCVEDLKFGLEGEIESIKTAKEYIKNIMDVTNEKIVIIGHSKGGTVGQYGYVGMPLEYRSRIIKVFNLDGPETKDGIPESLIDEANAKILKVVTKRSIFGLLLGSNHDYKVTNGKAFWLLHHMVYNWEIDDRQLRYIKTPSKKTLKRRDTILSFIGKRSDSEVKEIIDDVESILHKSEIYFLRDIKLVRLFKAYIQLLKLIFNKRRGKEDIKFFFMCMKVFL